MGIIFSFQFLYFLRYLSFHIFFPHWHEWWNVQLMTVIWKYSHILRAAATPTIFTGLPQIIHEHVQLFKLSHAFKYLSNAFYSCWNINVCLALVFTLHTLALHSWFFSKSCFLTCHYSDSLHRHFIDQTFHKTSHFVHIKTYFGYLSYFDLTVLVLNLLCIFSLHLIDLNNVARITNHLWL